MNDRQTEQRGQIDGGQKMDRHMGYPDGQRKNEQMKGQRESRNKDKKEKLERWKGKWREGQM